MGKARFTDDTINRIKTEVSLLRLVEAQGHQPKKQGKDWSIRCPFHAGDDTPSLIISPQTNLFHCFGCGAAGSVIDWVMKTQGVSFRFACEILQNDAGLVAESSGLPVKKNTTTKLTLPLAASADQQTALRQVLDYYHHIPLCQPSRRLCQQAEVAVHEEIFSIVDSHRHCETSGWRDGHKIWTVTHDAQQGLYHLEANGDLPKTVGEIRERLMSVQKTASKRADVDYSFDIPVELAASLTGFRHDRELPAEMGEEPYEVLE